MDFSIAGQDLVPLQSKGPAKEIGGLSACLFDEQTPGGHIPRAQLHFPEAVKTTSGHIAKVQGSRPRPSDGLGAKGEILEMIEIVRRTFPKIVRETGGEETLG